MADPGEIVRSRRAQLHDGIEFRLAEVDRVETAGHRVHLVGGESIAYGVLVVVSRASLLPDETEGLTGPGWGERIFTFYELESATALREALAAWACTRCRVHSSVRGAACSSGGCCAGTDCATASCIRCEGRCSGSSSGVRGSATG
jgi:NADH dehydrogenase FAD-containing subunit